MDLPIREDWVNELVEPLRISVDEVSGDFERVFALGWLPVCRYCLVLTADRDEAEEVAAETFKRAYEAWTRGRGPSGAPIPWLLTIARRIVIDRTRRGRLVVWLRILPQDRAASAQDEIDNLEVWIWFQQLCRALPARQREVLLMRYGLDLSDQEIGRILGMTAGSARTTIARALARLRTLPEVSK